MSVAGPALRQSPRLNSRRVGPRRFAPTTNKAEALRARHNGTTTRSPPRRSHLHEVRAHKMLFPQILEGDLDAFVIELLIVAAKLSPRLVPRWKND